MTLRHMKIYVSVFRLSSMTKAAEELHLAQPSVSLAVRELEDYYGVRLFERIGRHIYPTEAGKEFYSYAVHIVSLFEEMEKKIRNWDTLGILRIGSSITIGTRILPSLIARCQTAFPDLRVEAVVSNSTEIEKKILNNAIDIGLIETQTGQKELCSVPFMQDCLCAILPPGHPLAGQKDALSFSACPLPLFLCGKKAARGGRSWRLHFPSASCLSVRCGKAQAPRRL